ncbi:MAG: hypothetical protein JWQ66_3249 [Mucilaginibacter sp.]|nr:hypothetical protein [Mucilaginibacter sp.]
MEPLVEAIFQNHYNYYRKVGIETIKQQAGQVEQVAGDYQGRVIYELLQNALDKAHNQIKIMVKEGHLYIANDGAPFTYRSGYDYLEGSEMRGDFQALCSISTSEKDVNFSIGNKGVGFKSVFAVSAEGFADIHTQGTITNKRSVIKSSLISFRVYDSFRDPGAVPKLLPREERENLKSRIVKSNRFNKNKGVPGYYYPMLITHRDEQVQQLLNEGYITIIQIKIRPGGNEQIASFFKDIKLVNFHFIQLRVKYPVQTTFEFEGWEDLNFKKELKVQTAGRFFSCFGNERIRQLAVNANINIDHPQVAVYFKPGFNEFNGPAKLYNYLPTNMASPFQMVDFHADFHTTVDRTGINKEDVIGDYNKALLEACTELYFFVLNGYLAAADRISLDFKYLDPAKLPELSNFRLRWSFLWPDSGQEGYYAVRRLLGIESSGYRKASLLIAKLAAQYFTAATAKDNEGHTLFFVHAGRFMEGFARTGNMQHSHVKDFKRQLAEALKELEVPIIPNGSGQAFAAKDEIIYRENWKDTDDSVIPSFIGLNITGFKIPDEDLEKMLGVKNIIVSNEVLKYYRQVKCVTGSRPIRKSSSSTCSAVLQD